MTCYGGSGARTSTFSMPTDPFVFLSSLSSVLSLRALSVSHMISIFHSHSLPVRIDIDCSTHGHSPRLLTSSFNLSVCTLIFYRFFGAAPIFIPVRRLFFHLFFLLSSTVRTINFTFPPHSYCNSSVVSVGMPRGGQCPAGATPRACNERTNKSVLRCAQA